MATLYTAIDSNKRQTIIIMIVFIVFISLLAYVFGEGSGYGIEWTGLAIIVSGLMSFSGYYFSDKIVLGISGAREVKKEDNPQLYNLVENLCIGAGLPLPRIYTIEDTAPNAFATGRDPQHAVICFTTGILSKLNKMELEGVVAHELSHIGNYDTRLMSIVVVLVGIVVLMSDWFRRFLWFGGGRKRDRDSGQLGAILAIVGIVLAILSPIFAELMKLALSRQREYLADASASLLTRYPEGLASALEKIAADREPLEVANKATAHLYIINPLKDHKGSLNSLFSTHPPVEERIARLRNV